MDARLDLFSPDYNVATARFRESAASVGARLESHPVHEDGTEPTLSIDVAIIGATAPRCTVLVSSGLHGIEGFFGSAIQLGWLSSLGAGLSLPAGTRVVLVHAVNPFGFAQRRRVNEDNVDLNRNFLNPPQRYEGCPAGYAELDPLLNPASPPARFEPFKLKALWYIRRFGMPALKAAVAGGQYQFARGLFFGGHAASTSTRLMRGRLHHWAADAPRVIHIDLHSGLGVFARHRLLLHESADSPEVRWYRETFGHEAVEPSADAENTAYDASGTLGEWAISSLGPARYRFVTAEFGTYPIVRVLAALRAENRAHHFGRPGNPAVERAKRELVECFCPDSERWRTRVVDQGLRIIERAIGGAANE